MKKKMDFDDPVRGNESMQMATNYFMLSFSEGGGVCYLSRMFLVYGLQG
jgi:hypothetical protein